MPDFDYLAGQCVGSCTKQPNVRVEIAPSSVHPGCYRYAVSFTKNPQEAEFAVAYATLLTKNHNEEEFATTYYSELPVRAYELARFVDGTMAKHGCDLQLSEFDHWDYFPISIFLPDEEQQPFVATLPPEDEDD